MTMRTVVVPLLVGAVFGGVAFSAVGAQPAKLRSRTYFMPQDFETKRPDGRFECHATFAWDYVRRMVPEYSFDKVKDASEMAAWRAKVRGKLRELLQIPEPLPKLEFKLISDEPRDGYRLYRYEFYPEDRLVIPILVLVPEAVIREKRKVPAMVCMPGSGASLNSLAGEPEPKEYSSHYPARNRQAWHYAQIGMIGVAIENPGTAESGLPEAQHWLTQNQFARFMILAGRSNWGFMVEHVLETIEFLKNHPNVNPKQIGVSGMSLGCIPALYAAVASDDVAAVVYNDFVSSWAANAVSATTRISYVDPRRPFGFHRWFDDEPDLMAAVAPRPMIFTEGGAWKGVIEKVQRAYRMSGAEDNLCIRYYEKYSDVTQRKHEDVDLHKATNLTDDEYLNYSNVDARDHSFHPDVNLPWIAKTFFGKAEFDNETWREIYASVAWPEFTYRPFYKRPDYEQLRREALDRKRLVIWDDDGCDMTHYPYQRPDLVKYPASVRHFECVFLEATERTKVDAIGYSGTMGFGYFTALKTGGDVNTNCFAEGNEPWRNAVNEFKALGHDSMEMATAFARRNGREIFLSLRFNDNHDCSETVEKPGIMLSPFKIKNPEVRFGHGHSLKCCGRNAADFAQEKVRAFAKKYVRGYLENYDLDGIEFDFFRHPQLFRTVGLGGHATPAELELMTQLMKDFRAMAEEVGRKRGRPFVLAARVPDSFEYCKAIGIDLDAWLKAKTLDFLIVGGYFQLNTWKTMVDAVHRYGIKCYASIDETRIHRVKGVRCLSGRDSKECWIARMAEAMASGADGVNLFNFEYFDHELQREVLNYDVRNLDGIDKVYFATYVGGGGYVPKSFLVGGDDYLKNKGVNPARPVKLKAGNEHAFEFAFGDDLSVPAKKGKDTLVPRLTMTLLCEGMDDDVPEVKVNGRVLANGSRVGERVVYRLDAKTFVKGANAVSVKAASDGVLHDFSVRVRFLKEGAEIDAGYAFSNLPKGPFKELKSAFGVWKADAGNAEVYVDDHDTDCRAVRIVGGDGRTVTLECVKPMPSDGLAIRLERFTGRFPYAIRVEARQEDGAWQEVYAESGNIPTKARRKINFKKLAKPVTSFRISASNSGVLIWPAAGS